jgi:hypothetical protein
MSYDRRMSLLLPGERRFRWLEVFVAMIVVLGLCALGCATPRAHTRGAAPSVFQAARFEARRSSPVSPRHADEGPAGGSVADESAAGGSAADESAADESAAFVERALHDAGFRFGTDGSTRALWGYLRSSHRLVDAREARPGDILLFDTRGVAPRPECADRAGIVESVGASGRITFVEARAGRVRRSFVDPAHPFARRDARGEILNSFLRPIRIDDPPGARYFAGEMLCGIARAR